MNWRVALIDSCGRHPKARVSASFVSHGNLVRRRESDLDYTGHGTRIAEILTRGSAFVELVLAQVFIGRAPASAAAVAAAVDWAVTQGSRLVHLSLGLSADRKVLLDAIIRALDQGLLVVAASPARGDPVFPAAYPGVIGATGDARCAVGEVSQLGPSLFGACPRANPGLNDRRPSGGASIGAAWLSHAILQLPPNVDAESCRQALASRALYRGPELRLPALDATCLPVQTAG